MGKSTVGRLSLTCKINLVGTPLSESSWSHAPARFILMDDCQMIHIPSYSPTHPIPSRAGSQILTLPYHVLTEGVPPFLSTRDSPSVGKVGEGVGTDPPLSPSQGGRGGSRAFLPVARARLAPLLSWRLGRSGLPPNPDRESVGERVV